ncbi:hypothetical protein [Azospirillum palustre]
MTDKFTKGPWTLTQSDKWPFYLVTTAASGAVIAEDRLAFYSTSDTVEKANAREGNAEQIANAKLRAAAPSLLEALEEMTALFEMDDEANEPGTDSYAVLHLARAVIASARGQER